MDKYTYSIIKNPASVEVAIKRRGRYKKIFSFVVLICCILLTCYLDKWRLISIPSEALLSSAIFILPHAYVLKLLWKRLLVLSEEWLFHFRSRHQSNFHHLFSVCFKDIACHLVISVVCCVVQVLLYVLSSIKPNLTPVIVPQKLSHLYSFLPVCVLVSLVLASLEMLTGHNNLIVNNVLREGPTMAHVFADGAYTAYYQKVLEDIRERILKFESEHSISVALKKLVLVIPLSCDVRGTLEKYHQNIQYVGDLPHISTDQGANMNRKYKNPVYRITNGNKFFHQAVEQPNSLLTFWCMKNSMKDNIWKNDNSTFVFLRNTFISELQKHLAGKDCVVLLYDDTKPHKLLPMSEFLQNEIAQLVSDSTTTCEISMNSSQL